MLRNILKVGLIKGYLTRSVSTVSPKRGVLPAYDEALDFLSQYQKEHVKLAESIDSKIKVAPSSEKELLEHEKYLALAESELHLPSTYHQFKSGDYDLSKPVFQYLKKQQFESNYIPMLKQRLQQMFVIPDALPNQEFNVQLDVTFPNSNIEPGSKLECKDTLNFPEIKAHCFHQDEKLYTLAMVGIDAPDQVCKNYQQQIYYLATDIPLSLKSSIITSESGKTIIPYSQPLPNFGTGYHRYTFILFEQHTPNALTFTPAEIDVIKEHSSKISGITFHRIKHDDSVSKYYQNNDELEPIFEVKPELNPRVGKDGRVRNRYLNA